MFSLYGMTLAQYIGRPRSIIILRQGNINDEVTARSKNCIWCGWRSKCHTPKRVKFNDKVAERGSFKWSRGKGSMCYIRLAFFSSSFKKKKKKQDWFIYYFRESVYASTQAARRGRGRGRESHKQSLHRAQNPTQSSLSHEPETMTWAETKSDASLTVPPRCPSSATWKAYCCHIARKGAAKIQVWLSILALLDKCLWLWSSVKGSFPACMKEIIILVRSRKICSDKCVFWLLSGW